MELVSTTNSMQAEMQQVSVKLETNDDNVKDPSTLDTSNPLVGDEADSTSEKKSHEEYTSTIAGETQEPVTDEFPVLSKSALKRKKKAELWEQRKKEKRFVITSYYFGLFKHCYLQNQGKRK